MIVKIINFYSLADPMCFLETDMDREMLDYAVAYLQIIRDQLPTFKINDFDLREEEVKNLLISLYECKDVSVSGDANSDYTLDLFGNWLDYVMQMDFETIERKARRDGVRAIMIVEIIKTIESRNATPNYYAKKCLNILRQLRGFALDEEVISFTDLVKGQDLRKLDVNEAYKQLARMIHYILDDIGDGIETKFLKLSKCDDDGNPVGILPPESGVWLSEACSILDIKGIPSQKNHEEVMTKLKEIARLLSVAPPSLVNFQYVINGS